MRKREREIKAKQKCQRESEREKDIWKSESAGEIARAREKVAKKRVIES